MSAKILLMKEQRDVMLQEFLEKKTNFENFSL